MFGLSTPHLAGTGANVLLLAAALGAPYGDCDWHTETEFAARQASPAESLAIEAVRDAKIFVEGMGQSRAPIRETSALMGNCTPVSWTAQPSAKDAWTVLLDCAEVDRTVHARWRFNSATRTVVALDSLARRLSYRAPATSAPPHIYPGGPRALVVLPTPIPRSIKPYELIAEFNVSETGEAELVAWTKTRDVAYNNDVLQLLRTYQFRSAIQMDGRPVRSSVIVRAMVR